MKHKMSLILFCTLIVLMVGGNQAADVSAGNSAFTYQGRFAENGNPENSVGQYTPRLPSQEPTPEPKDLPATSAGSVPLSEFPGGGRSDHNHLGQTWTGSDPLVINGTYGEPWNTPLVLSNDSGDGLRIFSAARHGVTVDSAGRNGFLVESAGTNGLRVASATRNGVIVESAGGDGVAVESAGNNGLSVESASNGLWVGNAGVLGVGVDYAKEVAYWVHKVDGSALWVDEAGGQAIGVGSAGENGLYIANAGNNGIAVDSASYQGLYVGSAGDNGLYVANSGNNGVAVDSAGTTGLYVKNAGVHGVAVDSAGNVGLYVGSAGDHGLYVVNAGVHGVAVDSAGAEGLYVGSAGDNGLYVANSGNNGVAVVSANNAGLWVGSAGSSGLHVASAGTDGVHVDSAGGYAGWFGGTIYARDGCVGCTITMFGVNAGNTALQPGDIVSIQGLLPSQFAEVATLMQVKTAENGETVIGVVQGWADVSSGADSQQGKSADRLVPRQGTVEPGQYVTIIIYGPAQVKASALSGPLSAGTRLTLGDDGGVRTLKTTEVNGVQIAESASTIGIALEEPGNNELIWVLVNPQ